MFVKFDSNAGGFTMSRDIAVQLLKAMGHSGTIPSAILPGDIPHALARLKSAMDASPGVSLRTAVKDDQNREDLPVSLRQRAFPLIDLLTRAAREEVEVMWR